MLWRFLVSATLSLFSSLCRCFCIAGVDLEHLHGVWCTLWRRLVSAAPLLLCGKPGTWSICRGSDIGVGILWSPPLCRYFWVAGLAFAGGLMYACLIGVPDMEKGHSLPADFERKKLGGFESMPDLKVASCWYLAICEAVWAVTCRPATLLNAFILKRLLFIELVCHQTPQTKKKGGFAHKRHMNRCVFCVSKKIHWNNVFLSIRGQMRRPRWNGFF